MSHSYRPYSLSNPPAAPKKVRPQKPYSLDNPPQAPKRVQPPRRCRVGPVRRLVLPQTPPTVAPETTVQWPDVREKYLCFTPKDIEEETCIPFLEHLWELYFPFSQPRNAYEEAYLSLMRECIDSRLGLLRQM